jgi:hypothetical protein
MLKLNNQYIPWSRIKSIEHMFGTISSVKIHFTDDQESLWVTHEEGKRLLQWLEENSVDVLKEGEKLLLSKEQR